MCGNAVILKVVKVSDFFLLNCLRSRRAVCKVNRFGSSSSCTVFGLCPKSSGDLRVNRMVQLADNSATVHSIKLKILMRFLATCGIMNCGFACVCHFSFSKSLYVF